MMSQSPEPSRSSGGLIAPSLEELSFASCVVAEAFPARSHLSLPQTGRNHQSVHSAQQWLIPTGHWLCLTDRNFCRWLPSP